MKENAQIPAKLADYHVLSVQLPSTPILSLKAKHLIYFKPHTPNIPTIDAARSLFLVNIPVDSTEAHFRHLFGPQIGLPAGRIQQVQFEDAPIKKSLNRTPGEKKSKKRKRVADDEPLQPIQSRLPSTWDRETHASGSTAILVFVDKASADSAIRAARSVSKKGSNIVWGQGIDDKIPALGSKRYTRHAELMFPPRDVLLKAANEYMTEFNERQEAAAKELARKRSVPDADGFITVTRGGRNAAARMEDAKESLQKQKERQKGLNDFYRFQGREVRKERAAELVKKFEEDKEKVRLMKASRKSFKPE